ncbi:unnamed protein product [Nippostrongylus brasiliensis]|uniref:Tyrosine-protein phosphatase domain-containing protein n=1 Tax=Nippostrongylus brasiliensis TaxID=27835 RepID=A0A0N4YMK0_NIPBR|nr:unnamed protein product [Nippostrongylus brasiliensis]
MVLDEQCRTIVMLCKCIENKSVKCAPYYPTVIGGSVTFDHIKITLQKQTTSKLGNVVSFWTIKNNGFVADDVPETARLFMNLNFGAYGVGDKGKGKVIGIDRSMRRAFVFHSESSMHGECISGLYYDLRGSAPTSTRQPPTGAAAGTTTAIPGPPLASDTATACPGPPLRVASTPPSTSTCSAITAVSEKNVKADLLPELDTQMDEYDEWDLPEEEFAKLEKSKSNLAMKSVKALKRAVGKHNAKEELESEYPDFL